MRIQGKAKLLWTIFITFFKIGMFTFGGGYAMISWMEGEVIQKRRWIEAAEFTEILALSSSVPGAVAINASVFIGHKTAGRLGAMAAMSGVVLPSFMIITLIAGFFMQARCYPVIKAVFSGVRAAIVALILLAALKIGKEVIKDVASLFIMSSAMVLVLFFNVHAITVIIGGALAGFIILACLAGKKRNAKGKNHDLP